MTKQSHEYYSDKRISFLEGGKVIVWFSCGATSAVAAKLAVQKYKGKKEVQVLYCDTGSEHESNMVFLKDVERWIDHPITILKNPKYKDHWDVIEKERFLVGPGGAKCTAVLKRKLRHENSDPMADIQVFGYSVEEIKRANIFRQNNFEAYLETPLIDQGLDKTACLAIIQEEGIDLPFLYQPQKSGHAYDHNNCIGCVKGGAGYWNKIRIDFPEVFERMSQLEQWLGRKIVKLSTGRVYLKDLDPNAGRAKKIPPIQCDLLCGAVLDDIREADERPVTKIVEEFEDKIAETTRRFMLKAEK